MRYTFVYEGPQGVYTRRFVDLDYPISVGMLVQIDQQFRKIEFVSVSVDRHPANLIVRLSSHTLDPSDNVLKLFSTANR